jgi:hypothetical protein
MPDWNSLSILDNDETHDLVMAENILPRIVDWLGGIKGFPIAPYGDSTGILLFERYTVWDFPWADKYSYYLWELYEWLSQSGRYEDVTFTGFPDIKSVFYGNRLVGKLPLDFGIPDVMSVRNTNSFSVAITYLERDDYEQSTPYSINSNPTSIIYTFPLGYIYRKRLCIIEAGQECLLDTRQACPGSLVVSEGAEKIEGIPATLLYLNLDFVFGAVQREVENEFPQLGYSLKKCGYELKMRTRIKDEAAFTLVPIPGVTDQSGYEGWTHTLEPTSTDIFSLSYEYQLGTHDLEFEPLPDWYSYSAFLVAKNNAWNNVPALLPGDIPLTDQGKEILIETWGTGIYYHLKGRFINNSNPETLVLTPDTPIPNLTWEHRIPSNIASERGAFLTGWKPEYSIFRPFWTQAGENYSFSVPLTEPQDYTGAILPFIGFWDNRWREATDPYLIRATQGFVAAISAPAKFTSTVNVYRGGDEDAFGRFQISDSNFLWLYQEWRGITNGQFSRESGLSNWVVVEQIIDPTLGSVTLEITRRTKSLKYYSPTNYEVAITSDPIQIYEPDNGSLIGAPGRTYDQPNSSTQLFYGQVSQLIEYASVPRGYSWSAGGGIDVEVEYPYRGTIDVLKWETEPVLARYSTAQEVEETANRLNQLSLNEDADNDYMPDSKRIKEIHAALGAGDYAYDPQQPSNYRWANLGKLIEATATLLGYSVNADGTIRPIRQSKYIAAGQPIPAGWILGQWGRNHGGNTEGQTGGNPNEERFGLAYEVRSNKFDVDPYKGTPSKITNGGYVLVENLPQLLHILLDDLDKALGWQDLGALAITSPNDGKPVGYEGLASLILELAYGQSRISRQTSGAHISSMITQATLYEVLASLGVAVQNKEFEVKSGIYKGKVPYPGLNLNAPSLMDVLIIILINLSQVVARSLVIPDLPEEEP